MLDRLSDEWLVIHAVPVGTAGSDIDHVVVGPAGVFTINSKYHEGMKVWVGGKTLMVNGQRTDHLRNAGFEAKRVTKLLTRATGLPIMVTPIITIVAAGSITVRERPADVVVLSSTQLVRWLERRPRLLTDDQLNRLTTAALDPATWGSPSLPAVDLGASPHCARASHPRGDDDGAGASSCCSVRSRSSLRGCSVCSVDLGRVLATGLRCRRGSSK